jgi:PKD repeat protein
VRRLLLVLAVAVLALGGCGDDDDDDDGAAAVPPTAGFTYAIDIDTSGSTVCRVNSVTFTDTSTGEPTSWSWEWDDGQTSTDADPTWEPDDPSITEVVAELTVENDAGSDTYSETLFFPVC